MQSHSKFNKVVGELIQEYPNDMAYQWVKAYHVKAKYRDYHQTLDNLGLQIGVEFIVRYEHAPKDKTVYFPQIRYQKRNKFGEEQRTVDLDPTGFKNEADCLEYLGRHYMYKISELFNADVFSQIR